MASTTLMQSGGSTKWSNLTHEQWRTQLHELLLHSDKAVERAIVRIYDLQTDDEKISQKALHYDAMGFNRVDTPILSSFAQNLKAGRHLSYRQMCIARARITKYWRQLMKLSKIKQGEL